MSTKTLGNLTHPFPEDFEFDLSSVDLATSIDHTVVSFWIPTQAKAKYDLLQEKSKRKFGRHLKGLIMRSIDQVKIDDAG